MPFKIALSVGEAKVHLSDAKNVEVKTHRFGYVGPQPPLIGSLKRELTGVYDSTSAFVAVISKIYARYSRRAEIHFSAGEIMTDVKFSRIQA